MLTLTIPGTERWDSDREEFISSKETTIKLEHSLVSISKWEAKWCKPFLGKEQKTEEQTIDYIKFMTITQNVPDEVYWNIGTSELKKVNAYIEAPMTATWFSQEEKKKGGIGETVTSELIYYWMVALNIPFECQKWHLNRLITLIRVCNVKNTPPKKMNKRDLQRRNSSLNAQRRAAMNSRG